MKLKNPTKTIKKKTIADTKPTITTIIAIKKQQNQ